MKQHQIENIEKGFGEVISRLEVKRDALKAEFSARYDEELSRFVSKIEMIG